MKKLIFTALVMLIAFSCYSQSISGKENNGQSTAERPSPAVYITSEGFQSQNTVNSVAIQSKSSKPSPAFNNISLGIGIFKDQKIEKAKSGMELNSANKYYQAKKEIAIPAPENNILNENTTEKDIEPNQNAKREVAQPAIER